jgi:leucyl aminopeptidase
VLIPAVENAVSGNAFRPLDIFKTRKGLHGRDRQHRRRGPRHPVRRARLRRRRPRPTLLIDLATLTGAARVALGGQLPALFSNRIDTARDLVDLGLKLDDPLWHMPLWAPVPRRHRKHASATSSTPARARPAGAINAALFLEDFVPDANGLAARRPVRLERRTRAPAARWAARRRRSAPCWPTSSSGIRPDYSGAA